MIKAGFAVKIRRPQAGNFRERVFRLSAGGYTSRHINQLQEEFMLYEKGRK
jgi:hypothetical protein